MLNIFWKMQYRVISTYRVPFGAPEHAAIKLKPIRARTIAVFMTYWSSVKVNSASGQGRFCGTALLGPMLSVSALILRLSAFIVRDFNEVTLLERKGPLDRKNALPHDLMVPVKQL